jgi:protein-S-isoprenylcysteine O-methyltransferase Ste14
MDYEKVAGEMVEITCKPLVNFYRLVTILFGMALLLVVVPLFLLLASSGIEEYFFTHRFRVLHMMLGLFSLVLGFYTVIWTLISQSQTAHRTSDPVASTQKLTIQGLKFRCGNPLLLGSIIYCFGVGTILGSVTMGLIMFCLSLVLGTCYVKFIEKRDLYIRLGQKHKKSSKKGPFLILRF